jgi:signal transduction histidine kinase
MTLLYTELAVPDNRGHHESVGLSPELRVFIDLAHAAQGARDVPEMLRRICRSIAGSFGFERIGVSRCNPGRDEIEPLAVHGVSHDLLAGVPRALEEYPLLERAAESGQPIFVEDVEDEVPPEVARMLGIRSAFVAPLVTEGRCLGFIGADKGGRPFSLDKHELDLLAAIAAVVAVFLEKQLMQEELARLEGLKNEFIGFASHELREPAALIHIIAQTLYARGDELTREQRVELRKRLFQATDRLRRLVDQLLDLSRLEAIGIRMTPEPVSVRARIDEILPTAAGERAAEVTVAVPPDLRMVVDPSGFDRIVSNLIANAVRYGDMPIVVSAEERDQHFRLRVEDRGPGVPSDFVPRLFERFTRSRRAGADPGGAGLGLAIAQSYAHAHGGELFYEDADPHGARFELVLPRRTNA